MHGVWRRYLFICYTWQEFASSTDVCGLQQVIDAIAGTIGSGCMYRILAEYSQVPKHASQISMRASRTTSVLPVTLP